MERENLQYTFFPDDVCSFSSYIHLQKKRVAIHVGPIQEGRNIHFFASSIRQWDNVYCHIFCSVNFQ